MAYKKQYFEWDVTADELLSGTPVGYEVEFAQNSRFYPILYKLSTFDEMVGETVAGTFYYSLDSGVTWAEFPLGENGMTFYQPHKIRLVVNATEAGYIFAQRNATVYRITGDGKSIIDSYEIGNASVFNEIDIQEENDVLCLMGGDTLYRLYTGESMTPYSYSVNLGGIPIGMAVDSYRKSFWEIGIDKVSLKNFHGESIFSVNNPLSPIDVDCSSSSSSSSSSLGYSESSVSSVSSDSSRSSGSSDSSRSSDSSSTNSSSSSDSSRSSGSSDSSRSSDSSSTNSSSSSSNDVLYVSGFGTLAVNGTYAYIGNVFGGKRAYENGAYVILWRSSMSEWAIWHSMFSYLYQTPDSGGYYPLNSGWYAVNGVLPIGTVTQ